jgi:hypothetical protein
MKITTFSTEDYRECKIYYRNFLHLFEYLVVIDGEIYTSHIQVIPTLYDQILFWCKITKSPYSDGQLKDIIKQLRRLAETTIDYIKDPK